MEKPKINKGELPEENKDQSQPPSASPLPPNAESTNLGEEKGLVRIRFRPNRAAEGVAADANGLASVDAKLAEYLVSIGYADYAG